MQLLQALRQPVYAHCPPPLHWDTRKLRTVRSQDQRPGRQLHRKEKHSTQDMAPIPIPSLSRSPLARELQNYKSPLPATYKEKQYPANIAQIAQMERRQRRNACKNKPPGDKYKLQESKDAKRPLNSHDHKLFARAFLLAETANTSLSNRFLPALTTPPISARRAISRVQPNPLLAPFLPRAIQCKPRQSFSFPLLALTIYTSMSRNNPRKQNAAASNEQSLHKLKGRFRIKT